jgi:hypothetical protein
LGKKKEIYTDFSNFRKRKRRTEDREAHLQIEIEIYHACLSMKVGLAVLFFYLFGLPSVPCNFHFYNQRVVYDCCRKVFSKKIACTFLKKNLDSIKSSGSS